MPEAPDLPADETPAAPSEALDRAGDEGAGDEGAGDESTAAETAAVEADWLERICPYLLSEDGTYRSSQPDPGHRCTAQDPPATLPSAFQERFCLTERHVRCEMYKYAQSARTAALEQEGIPADQVESARFRPSVRSVPLALGPSGKGEGDTGAGSRRAIVIAAAGIAIVAIIFFIVVLLLSGSGDPGSEPVADASPSAEPTAAPTATPTPTPGPTPEPTFEPDATVIPTEASSTGLRRIEYEVQEGEALLKVAEAFGVSRRRIIRANEGMADRQPFVEPGDVIIVPVAAELAEADIQATPGFVRFIEEGAE